MSFILFIDIYGWVFLLLYRWFSKLKELDEICEVCLICCWVKFGISIIGIFFVLWGYVCDNWGSGVKGVVWWWIYGVYGDIFGIKDWMGRWVVC